MARDISIAISAKDNFSQAITTMRNANQAFNKDLTGLQAKLDALNKTKVSLKVEVDKAKKELKEAEKQFTLTGDAVSKMNLELANINYEKARRNLALVSESAKQAEKDILKLTDAYSKAENKASRNSGTKSMEDSASNLLNTLAKSGAINFVGNVLSDTALTYINSAFGQVAGTMASSVLSGATSGAAIGNAIAPGIGAAVGAIGGAILGSIQGQNEIFKKRDDAFKSYYQDLYNDVLETQEQALLSGKGIASTRETDRMSFATLLGGDNKAKDFLNSLTGFAASTPFAYDELTKISKVLLAYGYKQDEILPLLTKVGDAGSALGMSTEDMKYVATALGRMQTTGKTTLEYLNPLLERGIDVWAYLAEASGKTKKEVQEMVSKGLVPGEKAAKAIADYMGYYYKGNMEKQAETYAGLISTLEDANAELQNAMGEGYISTRKEGLQEQIDWLNEDTGMQDAYKKIGQWKASLENLSEQYQREALIAVMEGTISSNFSAGARERLAELYEEYTKLAADQSEEAGAKMGALLAEAQAIAINEYNASDGAQLLLRTNLSLAANIRDDSALKDAYWQTGYAMGLQFSKGYEAAVISNERKAASKKAEESNTDTSAKKESFGLKTMKFLFGDDTGTEIYNDIKDTWSSIFGGNSHATGISYVPYDNYPAILHQGERVLTASENRNYRAGSTPINITGNTFIVRSENDIEEIAIQIASMINQALELST